MFVTINGKPSEVKDGSTLADLLDHLEIKREFVAVELNMDIVPKSFYDSRTLTAGDVIEIVQFVGGG
ncbi:MAG: sulfur carrier protein ThiS [Desulfuromonadales bacterium]|nr:sulfur carrier protein ThiS [Desulfuromonadales bacterium]